MNLAEYSIRNKVISWVVCLLLIIGGTVSFFNLGRLEFPSFPLPVAMVVTAYPGASAEQVEEEVTLQLEEAILELEAVFHIDSFNTPGLSQIQIELSEEYPASVQPEMWIKLNKKMQDVESSLPPGVSSPLVIDEFSDVFGILYNISSKDYNYRDLENYADFLKRELILVDGVRKISIVGTIQEQIVIELSQEVLNGLGLDPNWIVGLMANRNIVSNAGQIQIDSQSVRFHPTGEFEELSELREMIISPPSSNNLIRLGDIATISREYEEKPGNIYRSNGQHALSFGISFKDDVNVLHVGKAVSEKLKQLEYKRPIGIDLNLVYDQAKEVNNSINDFIYNLLISIAIVIIVLFLAMGMRSGLLMGSILLLTILGTYIGMFVMKIEIETISLGALIIALGMLVDNAIVITEGILVGLKQGLTRMQAINRVVSQTQKPLLGATIIAILAFAPIGLSNNATGDFLYSLFAVLMLSLSISWLLAITLTPFFAYQLFKDGIIEEDSHKNDPYSSIIFRGYRKFLSFALRFRMITALLTLLMLGVGVYGLTQVKQSFFPTSNTPIFYIDVWAQQGTDIRATTEMVKNVENIIMENKDIVNVTSTIGVGVQRFILTYLPERQYSSFAQIIVEVTSLEKLTQLFPIVRKQLKAKFPELEFKLRLMSLGPTTPANIEARFYGPDLDTLRRLAAQAVAIIDSEPLAVETRHTMREKTLAVRPQINTATARRAGISRQDINNTLLFNTDGVVTGLYREGSHLLPIRIRAPEEIRTDINRVENLQIWSGENSAYVPIGQVVDDFTTTFENSMIVRRDYRRVVSVLTDIEPLKGNTPEFLRQKLKEKIEAIPLPPGYSFEWGGEFEMQTRAQNALFSSLPLGYLAMFLITILLFNAIKAPLAIWFTVPLSLIGVACGLLILNIPFSFTALLGLISLSGMIVKNGIVLVEQIGIEKDKGSEIHQAIIDASVSRMRPVCMAALTTMLGMAPLIVDPFFASMAVTIVFGLGFATILTLVVLPVTYATLYCVTFD